MGVRKGALYLVGASRAAPRHCVLIARSEARLVVGVLPSCVGCVNVVSTPYLQIKTHPNRAIWVGKTWSA